VQALEKLGVDYLGFNFWPGSKRYITPEQAYPLVSEINGPKVVGIFVDQTPAEIHRIARFTGIHYAQLHGKEDWDTLDALEIPVIKAIRADQLPDLGGLGSDWTRHACYAPEYLLIDSTHGTQFGGTGKTFDWTLLQNQPLPKPVFLAGGLNPSNLEAALKTYRPYAVDLNSGVETALGIKDPEKVRACLEILQKFQPQ
jgi:phosphoribosylanthranilate isomerase